MATPEQEAARVKQWIEDWQEAFTITYTEAEIEALVGSQVEVSRDDDDQRMTFSVVGYSKTLVAQGEDKATQFAILTSSGMMLQLKSGISLKIVS